MRPEDRLQVHCAKYLKAALPAPGFFSGIEHARKQSLYSGMVQKAKGIKRGLADLNIWYMGRYIGFELKVKSPISPAQQAFGVAMQDNGFRWFVVRSVCELHDLLVSLNIPVLPSMRLLTMPYDAALSVPAPKTKTATRPPRQRNPTAKELARAREWYAVRDKG